MQADLTIDGRLTAPAITGTLVASGARLEIDEIIEQFDAPPPLPAAVPDAESAAAQPAADAPPLPVRAEAGGEPPSGAATDAPGSPWAAASVDIAITVPDNLVIRASDLRTGTGSMGLGDLNLTLGGNVRLRKAVAEEPVVVGAVEVVRGFYEFQGRRFDVSRGSTVEFRGGEPSNPAINVTGEREVSGVTARVQITGTARQPVLALSSQPTLSESDILALIVFNQPLNQLGSGEQVDLLARASDMALGAVASTLTDSIGRALDVDLFEIRAPSAERPGEVSVGTQLSQRVFVGFRQQFGAADASRLSIEYRLTEALRMVSSVGQGGNERNQRTDAARLDLVYTIKY
jgi:translocation and assembly module TamB